MKHSAIGLFLSLLLFHTASAQHLALDIPLKIPPIISGSWDQQLDCSSYFFKDFAALSIVFEGPNMDAQAVSCSIKTVDSWKTIPHFSEEAKEGRFVSELLFVSTEDARQLTLRFAFAPEIDPSLIQGHVRVFSPTGESTAMATQGDLWPLNLDCPCPQPTFVSRSSWGAAFNLTGDIYIPPAVYTDVSHLIVHHSAGTNTSSNWPGVVAAVFDFHVNTNGWSDVGYNWLIAPNGQLFEGRGGGDNVRGAHMCGYNNNTMGVCLLGNFVNIAPQSGAMETLKRLLAWKCCKEAIVPEGSGPITSYSGIMKHISGHLDGCAPNYTVCPGGLLYGQLETLRSGVAGFMQDDCGQASGTNRLELKASFTVSPNPVADELNLAFSTPVKSGRISIIDVLGCQQIAQTIEHPLSYLSIPVEPLKPGFYWLVYESDINATVMKFLKL